MIVAILVYRNLFGISIIAEGNKQIICIPTGSSYEQVLDTLACKTEKIPLAD
jgi:hypothetical protein